MPDLNVNLVEIELRFLKGADFQIFIVHLRTFTMNFLLVFGHSSHYMEFSTTAFRFKRGKINQLNPQKPSPRYSLAT